jgi:hypothetical protein
MSAHRQGITTRQAVALVSEAVGWPVTLAKVGRVAAKLADDERMSAEYEHDGKLYPEDVDRVAGEVWRMRAGWYQKRNVSGDMDAWVMAKPGTWRLLRIPYERVWHTHEKHEDVTIPQELAIHAWPTGEVTGSLLRVEDREGLAAYVDASLYKKSGLTLFSEAEISTENENISEG